MNPPMTRQEANHLLTSLGSNDTGRRKRSAEKLGKYLLYPAIFTTPIDFINNCIKPIANCFDAESDAVREKCVDCCLTLIKQLGRESLFELFKAIFEFILIRIENEKKEEVSILLMHILCYLAGLPGPDTNPSTLDEYCFRSLRACAKKLTSKDPKMKLLCSDTVHVLTKNCSSECLCDSSALIVPPILDNINNKQLEVRKRSLLLLGDYLVCSGSLHSIENFAEIQEKMMQDEKMSFRIALVQFSEKLLVYHPKRSRLYSEHFLPIFASLSIMVPKRPILPGEIIVPDQETKESTTAFNALVNIGNQYDIDCSIDQKCEIQFNENRKICAGIVRLVQNLAEIYVHRLNNLVSDWKLNNRQIGLAAMSSLLSLASEYMSIYSARVLTTLITALCDHPEESESILRCIALMASLSPLSDVNAIILPKITSECQNEILEAFSVCVLNAKCTDLDLSNDIRVIFENSLFFNISHLNSCAKAVISICHHNRSFREANIVDILTIMLKIGQYSGELNVFENCFDKPINVAIGDNLVELLEVKLRDAPYLTLLLKTVPPEITNKINQKVCDALVGELKSPNACTLIYGLITFLVDVRAITFCTDSLLSSILDDMVWQSGKEFVFVREAATNALGSVIKKEALSAERMNESLSRIMPMALGSLDDQTSDLVRTSSILTMKEIVIRSCNLEDRFDRLFEALRDRLADPLNPVRVGAADLLGILLSKCTKIAAIPSRLREILVFLDDGSVEMREAICRLSLSIAQFPNWSKAVKNVIENICTKCYHPEASVLGKEIIAKIEAN